MRKIILSISILFALTACSNTNNNANQNQTTNSQSTTQQTTKVENFLNVPEFINFSGTDFHLSWSSHPSDNYYKEEFLPKDTDPEEYKQMIMVELALGNITTKDALSQKIRELEARKPGDKIVKYQVLENKNTNEVLLDFMVSEGQGEANIMVEWNAYRYSNYSDQTGRKGVNLFALSKRGYGKDSLSFVSDLIANRQKYVADFVALTRPEINLK